MRYGRWITEKAFGIVAAELRELEHDELAELKRALRKYDTKRKRWVDIIPGMGAYEIDPAAQSSGISDDADPGNSAAVRVEHVVTEKDLCARKRFDRELDEPWRCAALAGHEGPHHWVADRDRKDSVD